MSVSKIVECRVFIPGTNKIIKGKVDLSYPEKVIVKDIVKKRGNIPICDDIAEIYTWCFDYTGKFLTITISYKTSYLEQIVAHTKAKDEFENSPLPQGHKFHEAAFVADED